MKKSTKVIPYQTAEDLINHIKKTFPDLTTPITGFKIAAKFPHSTLSTSWGSPRPLGKDPSKYIMYHIDRFHNPDQIMQGVQRKLTLEDFILVKEKSK